MKMEFTPVAISVILNSPIYFLFSKTSTLNEIGDFRSSIFSWERMVGVRFGYA